MREHFLGKLSPLCLIKATIKAQDAPTAFQAVSGHLELVHGVHVLHMHLDRRSVRSLGCPHVKVLMPSCLEVQCVVAVVEVGEFGEKI
jgi:hypothetical protein